MGYCCYVTILAQSKAYEMIMDSIKEYNKTSNSDFGPDFIKKGNSKELGDLFVLEWDFGEWVTEWEDVQSVKSVLKNLREEHDEEMGYGYKQVILYEDNATEEDTNMSILDNYLRIVCDIEYCIGTTEPVEI